jgi:hypothetical protein
MVQFGARDASMTCDERSVEEQNGNEERVRRKEEGDLAVGKVRTQAVRVAR